uniref:Actin filament-associated protein 1 n=1 Tax=Amphiprion percula TaxID=161767 RepID=A0A3P8SUN4_AMPPE
MEVLVSELGTLLKMLDQEHLSSSTQEKKTSVWNLLQQIQPSGTDYIYMNSSVYRNGTSFVESLFETFDCELGDLKDQSCTDSPAPHSADSPPPLPTTPPPEEYYEEAVPLSPGKMPEYIITRGQPSPPNSIEDGYEDAENHYPTTCINSHRKNSYNDSDALSSSYESYEEDEEERSPGIRLTHQWPSDESSMPPARDCRICAFLLRKKRFGQWAKQLTVIRENRLQCYKSSKDTCPYVDLLLPQCTVVYVPKDSKRKHHELRFTLPNGDALVLAVQSKEQAHRWLKVVREVSSQSTGPEESASPVIPRKNELDKVNVAERMFMNLINLFIFIAGKVKRGALAAGRKITRIISFSKKKPPRTGDPRTSYSDPRQGYLSVLVSQVWREQWCCVCRGSLHFYHDKGDPRASLPSLPLHGCEVVPGLGPKHPFAFRVLRNSTEVAALEASSSDELGRWLGVILAETGSATDPESLHYDYVDVETIANIRDAARHSFLSTSTDSRTYDEVPNEDVQNIDLIRQAGQTGRRERFCPLPTTPARLIFHLCSHPDANQYGRYGKTRAEEDAKRYHSEKEELERERDGIRNALVTLRQQKRELKEELKTASEKRKPLLNKRVSQLEEACRAKEAERVDLELRLTQVKENLKKSLAGGALGAPVEAKPPVKIQNIYSDSLPVNCALEMRRRPPSVYASSTGTVMQKAKVRVIKFITPSHTHFLNNFSGCHCGQIFLSVSTES